LTLHVSQLRIHAAKDIPLRYLGWMRFLRVVPALATVAAFLYTFPAMSQSHVLHEISFVGAPAYTQAELQNFVGMKPGTSATEQQMQDAVEKLNATGLFADVNFAGNDKGIVYSLRPAPVSTARPVRYANFVWWSDEELNQALKTRVPLFRPEAVPTTGSIRENIVAALTALVAGKGVDGATVTSRLSSSRTSGASLAFLIESPQVIVRSLTLTNASPAMRPNLDPIVHDITGNAWDEAITYGDVAGRVSYMYRNNGYLDIAIVKQEHSVAEVTSRGIELDVSEAISEGPQYRVSQIVWPGSEMISTADFNKGTKLKAGDPDSPLALQESLQVIASAYGTKGYLTAKAEAPQIVDRNSHQVAYAISVMPGPQYHFRSVRWPDLSPDQAKSLDSAWQMKPGDIYDSSYAIRFLQQKGMLSKASTKVEVATRLDPAALTVDVTVTFSNGAMPAH
jgi:outer membrane protein assembly factor BamA